MYYVNPSTWWIGGVLAATLHNIPVQCTQDETARFTPPPGQTCETYTSAYASMSPGYLLPATGDGICRWCEYSVGDDYLASLNIKASDKWRDFGIFVAFVISNWALVYFFIWTVRIKGWSFGMGYLFGGLGKLVGLITKPFKGLGKKNAKQGDAEGKAETAADESPKEEQVEESPAEEEEEEKVLEGGEKADHEPNASEAKAQKANDATGEEGAHTMGGV